MSHKRHTSETHRSKSVITEINFTQLHLSSLELSIVKCIDHHEVLKGKFIKCF